MSKLFSLVKWGATLGSSPQSFLGARWVRGLLNRVPESRKRFWALRLLALSPHYFFHADEPGYRELPEAEYLEAEYKTSFESRKEIFDRVLAERLSENDTVIDYGCGPGFLAKIVSQRVRKVFAFDISEGALACARIINGSPNLDYIAATKTGFASVPDKSVDAVYSFAVVQHLTDEAFEKMLDFCSGKLAVGGRLYIHIQLLDDIWRPEDEWRADTSVKGKLKFRYGLHCFGRTEDGIKQMVSEKGFSDIKIAPMTDFLEVPRTDDVWGQHFLTAVKLSTAN